MLLRDLNPDWLLRTHFFGLFSQDEETGRLYLANPVDPSQRLPDEIVQDSIDTAVARLEDMIHVSIKRKEQVVEFHDYDRDLYAEYVHIVARRYPISKVHSLQITYGENGRVLWDVPTEMIQTKGLGSKFGIIKVLPMFGIARNYDPALAPLFQTTMGRHMVPSMIKLTYDHGLDGLNDEGSPIHLPDSLVRAIGLLAAMHGFNILGDLVIGAGIANISLSIDGISQSIGTTASAENAAFSARIIMHRKELFGEQGIPGLLESLITQWRRPPLGLL